MNSISYLSQKLSRFTMILLFKDIEVMKTQILRNRHLCNIVHYSLYHLCFPPRLRIKAAINGNVATPPPYCLSMCVARATFTSAWAFSLVSWIEKYIFAVDTLHFHSMTMPFFGGRGPPDIKGMSSLKVDNLTYRTTPEDLRRCFEKYGDIGDIYIPRDRFSRESRGFAFVR